MGTRIPHWQVSDHRVMHRGISNRKYTRFHHALRMAQVLPDMSQTIRKKMVRVQLTVHVKSRSSTSARRPESASSAVTRQTKTILEFWCGSESFRNVTWKSFLPDRMSEAFGTWIAPDRDGVHQRLEAHTSSGPPGECNPNTTSIFADNSCCDRRHRCGTVCGFCHRCSKGLGICIKVGSRHSRSRKTSTCWPCAAIRGTKCVARQFVYTCRRLEIRKPVASRNNSVACFPFACFPL